MSFVGINFTVPVDSQVESCVRTWGNRACGGVGLGFRSICGEAAERDRIMNTKLTAYLSVHGLRHRLLLRCQVRVRSHTAVPGDLSLSLSDSLVFAFGI